MNKFSAGITTLFILLAIVFASYSCSQQAIPEKAEMIKPGVVPAPGRVPSESEWDMLLREAKKEKWIVIASSRIMSLDYMRNLAKMEPIVTRDQRLQVEWVSQGKFSIAISPNSPIVSQFKKDGAPIEQTTPREGAPVTSSSGNIALMNKAPHPKAAKLFINWLLTREGQTLFSEALGFQSARLDVPTGHLDSDKIRNPEVKYFSAIDEEFLKTLPEYTRIAREIFGSLIK